MLAAALTGAQAASASEPGRAVALSASYTGELWHNTRGGLERGTRYLDNLTVAIEGDAQAWAGRGSRVLVEGLYNNGNSLSGDLVGDAQTVSNIESGPNDLRIYQALMEAPVGDAASLRVGLYDLNSEFDVLASANLFINSAHGIGTDIGQSGANGPSIFPITSLGARFAWSPSERWTVRTALLDGVPGRRGDPEQTGIDLGRGDGALLAVELERDTPSGKLLVGSWGYTAETAAPAAAGTARNAGVYLRGEWQAAASLALFVRAGWARDEVNVFEGFFGAGLHWRGPLAGRPEDRLGLAVAWAEASDSYRRSLGAESREVAVELTYRLQLGERLALQPDLQYVVNPGLDPTLEDAVSLGMRFELILH